MRRFPLGPLITFATLALVTLAGGLYNSVEAQGVVKNAWTDEALEATIRLGQRTVVSAATDGTFYFGFVPRGVKLAVTANSFGRVDIDPTEREVKLEPATLNVSVKDVEGKAVENPAAYKGPDRLGVGTNTGSMVLAPHPGKDVPFDVCAEQKGPKQVATHEVRLEVVLEQGVGCPTPTPTPSPSPTPAPSPTAAPSPTPAPSPTGSP